VGLIVMMSNDSTEPVSTGDTDFTGKGRGAL